MKAVIVDTNVFVSGIFFSGPPHTILDAWRHGKLTLVVSPAIPRLRYRPLHGGQSKLFFDA